MIGFGYGYGYGGAMGGYAACVTAVENTDGLHQLGSNLKKIDWEKAELVPFVKDFFIEHAKVTARSPRYIEKWLKRNGVTRTGENIPRPVESFEEACFPGYIMEKVRHAGFSTPTPIQSVAWPVALKGLNLVGIASTGSGKTLAFALPGIVHINAQSRLNRGDGPIVLILAPTRELALQIRGEFEKFGESSDFRHTCVYGGVPKQEQIQELRRGVQVCIATPGRLIDLLEARATNLRRVTYLVLDEADRMLDMGFEPQIRQVLGQIRPDRQTLMWSATWPREVQQLAKDFLKEFVQINVGSLELTANKDVEQNIYVCSEEVKVAKLLELFRTVVKKRKALVFSATKRGSDQLAAALRKAGWKATAIHGANSQQQRELTLARFRKDPCGVLVATDVAGLFLIP
eukprot:TRINITY_DN14576_c0_g1_i2.p1 TRINITY_DN14576_c0_g1~~TRINITY_DN14576_c0_g1_i2.p1  ORF type:complete len:410 (-),score=64.96 TRINITY_DN14576_c0_g1_i2:377-1582(-)